MVTVVVSLLNRRLSWSMERNPLLICGTRQASTSSILKARITTLTLPPNTAVHTLLQMSSSSASLSAILSHLTMFEQRYDSILTLESAYTRLNPFQWHPTINSHRPDVPTVLVGTKPEFRAHPDAIERLRKRDKAPITFEQGQHMAQDIGATAYLEFWATAYTESSSKVPQSAINIMEAVASCL